MTMTGSDGSFSLKPFVIPREDMTVRDQVKKLAGYGAEFALYHHVPLSLFLDPRKYAGREQDCVYRTKAQLVFARPASNASVLLVVGCVPKSDEALVIAVLRRAGLSYSAASGVTQLETHLQDEMRRVRTSSSPDNDKRRTLINQTHWKSLRFIENLTKEFAEIDLPELLILSEVAMGSVIEYAGGSLPTLRGDEDRRKLDLLSKSSFDIVILRRNNYGEAVPLLALEVDGGVHERPEKRANDVLKDNICDEVGLCLLRLTPDNTYNFSYDRWLADSDADRYKNTPIDLLYFFIKRAVYDIGGLAKEIEQWDADCARRGTGRLHEIERRRVEDELWHNEYAYSVRPRPEHDEWGLQYAIWDLERSRDASVRFELRNDTDNNYYGVLEVTGRAPGSDLFLVSRNVRISGYACPGIEFHALAGVALARYLCDEALRIPLSRQSAQRQKIPGTRTGSIRWHEAEIEYLKKGRAADKPVADLAFALQRSEIALEVQLSKME